MKQRWIRELCLCKSALHRDWIRSRTCTVPWPPLATPRGILGKLLHARIVVQNVRYRIGARIPGCTSIMLGRQKQPLRSSLGLRASEPDGRHL